MVICLINSPIYVNVLLADLRTDEYVYKSMSVKEFIKSFKLKDGVIYDIGMDQSNTCTGIGIVSMDNTYLAMMEVINGGVDFSYYRNALLSTLSTILSGAKVRYFIMEEPLGYITGKRNKYLTELKNLLVNFFESGKGDNVSKFDRTAPQTWRSGLIKKDNPHPKNSKDACVYEIKKLFPVTGNFVSHVKPTTGKADFDGFESLGILVGFKNKHEIRNDSDVVKILGPKNGIKSGVAFFTYEDESLTEFTNLVTLVKECNPKLGEVVVKLYNEESTLYENVKMSLVDDFTVTSIVNDLDVISICNLFNRKMVDGYVMNMIVVPNSLIKPSFLKSLDKSEVHYELFY